MGYEGVRKSLEGFGDFSAYTQCSIGYIEKEGDEPIVFVGKTSVNFLFNCFLIPIKGTICSSKRC